VLGTLLFEDRQWDQAARNLEAAAQRMPEAPPKDAVVYRLGLCRERTGRWKAACDSFRYITRHFDGGHYLEAARRREQLKADHFAVQCGAFRQKSNAETLRGNLARKGLDAYLCEERRGRPALYVVLVGRYPGYEEAQRQLAMVREQFVSDAVLWP